MFTFLRWILSTILTVVIVAFSLANRETVTVLWSPAHDTLELPVFLVALVSLAIGFIAGGFLVWLNGGTRRKENRRMRKTMRKMEKDLNKISMPTQQAAEPESLFHE